MRASRFHQIVLFGFIVTMILGCDFLGNVSTPLTPSGAPPSCTGDNRIPSCWNDAGGNGHSSKLRPPVPSTPILGPAIPHLAAGQTFDITYIHMVDANQGWGIGGAAQARDHVFRTQTGGQTWHDTSRRRSQLLPKAGRCYCGPGVLRRCFQWLGCFMIQSTRPPVPPYILVWFHMMAVIRGPMD